MYLRNFAQIVQHLQSRKDAKRLAVASAADEHTLEAVLMAMKEGCVLPVLVGDAAGIRAILEKQGTSPDDVVIHDVADPVAAAQKAVDLVNAGEADLIMKGHMETAPLMKIIVNKENKLRTDRIMSHVAFAEIPSYHKVLALTDVALNTNPDLSKKRQILENAVEALHRLGCENPKVGVIAAAEEVNPKLEESVDAKALKELNQSGEINGCVVEGPITYDLATSREAVELKGYSSPVAGDADLLVLPGLAAGNLLIKSLSVAGGATTCGFVVGARVPVVLTSRASATVDKFMSVVLAAAAANGGDRG